MARYLEIRSTEALAQALKSSEKQPVLFFKHSNACGISQRAFREFERYLESPESCGIHNCLIVVQTARAASDEIAALLDVEHESPQAILVWKGRAVWHESHMAIKTQVLIAVIE